MNAKGRQGELCTNALELYAKFVVCAYVLLFFCFLEDKIYSYRQAFKKVYNTIYFNG